MKFRHDTYCGLYCGACNIFQANKNNMVEILAQSEGKNPGLLYCHGCKSKVNAVYCKNCRIKSCAENKGIEYCFQCSDYPCTSLLEFKNNTFHPHHLIVLNNLDHINNHGLKQWMEKQQQRWSCPNCGIEFTWYDKLCKECGKKIYNCIDEANNIVNEYAGR